MLPAVRLLVERLNCQPAEPAPFASVPPTKVNGPPCKKHMAGTPLTDVSVKLETTVDEIELPFMSHTRNCTAMVGVLALVNAVVPAVLMGARITWPGPLRAGDASGFVDDGRGDLDKCDGIVG